MMHKLLFILLFTTTAAAASEPAKIAQSPDGNLEILQKQSDGSYVLYTRYRAGRLKKKGGWNLSCLVFQTASLHPIPRSRNQSVRFDRKHILAGGRV